MADEKPLAGAKLEEVLAEVNGVVEVIKIHNRAMPTNMSEDPPNPWRVPGAEWRDWFRQRSTEVFLLSSVYNNLVKLKGPLDRLVGTTIGFSGELNSDDGQSGHWLCTKDAVHIIEIVDDPKSDWLIVRATCPALEDRPVFFDLLAEDTVLESIDG